MKLVAAPARLSTVSSTFDAEFAARLHWSAEQDAAIEQRVADILADVQKRGDAAVLEYTARFDGLNAPDLAALELTQAELQAAFDSLPEGQKNALTEAAARVRSYHEAQKQATGQSWSYRDADGTLLGKGTAAELKDKGLFGSEGTVHECYRKRGGVYKPGGVTRMEMELCQKRIRHPMKLPDQQIDCMSQSCHQSDSASPY